MESMVLLNLFLLKQRDGKKDVKKCVKKKEQMLNNMNRKQKHASVYMSEVKKMKSFEEKFPELKGLYDLEYTCYGCQGEDLPIPSICRCKIQIVKGFLEIHCISKQIHEDLLAIARSEVYDEMNTVLKEYQDKVKEAIEKSINKWDFNFSVTNEEIIEGLLKELGLK